MGDSIDRGENVDYVELSGPGTNPVRYTFHYALTTVPIAPSTNYVGSIPGAPPCNPFPGTTVCTTQLSLLTSIDLPDSEHFTFTYNSDSSSFQTDSQGLLADLKLPTGGDILYTYQLFSLPPADRCAPVSPRNSTPGIKERTLDGKKWAYKFSQAGSADLTGTLQAQQCTDD